MRTKVVLLFILPLFVQIIASSHDDPQVPDHRIVRRSFNMYVYAQGSGPIYGPGNNRTLGAGYGSTVSATSNTGFTSSGAPYVPPSPYSSSSYSGSSPYSSGIYAAGAGTPYRPPAPYTGNPYGTGNSAAPSVYGYNNPQKIGNYADDSDYGTGSSAGYSASQGLRPGGYSSSRPGSPYSAGSSYTGPVGSASYPGSVPYSSSRYSGLATSGSGYSGSGSVGTSYNNAASGLNRYAAGSGSYGGCNCPRDTYAYDLTYEINECNKEAQPYYCTTEQCDALDEGQFAIYAPDQVSIPICALGQAGYEVLDFATCFKKSGTVTTFPFTTPPTGYMLDQCDYEFKCSPPLQNADATPKECFRINFLKYLVETTGATGCDAYKACYTYYRCNVAFVCKKTGEQEVLGESKDIQLTLSTDCTGCHYCPETKESCLAKKYNFYDGSYGTYGNSAYSSSGYSQTTNYNG